MVLAEKNLASFQLKVQIMANRVPRWKAKSGEEKEGSTLQENLTSRGPGRVAQQELCPISISGMLKCCEAQAYPPRSQPQCLCHSTEFCQSPCTHSETGAPLLHEQQAQPGSFAAGALLEVAASSLNIFYLNFQSSIAEFLVFGLEGSSGFPR